MIIFAPANPKSPSECKKQACSHRFILLLSFLETISTIVEGDGKSLLHHPILEDQNATQEMRNKSYRETVACVGGSYTNSRSVAQFSTPVQDNLS